MAKSKNNVVTHGLSGLIGDLLVFRQRANKTIVADRPRPFSKPPTALQLGIQGRFKKAAQYAKTALLDPLIKAAYQAAALLGKALLTGLSRIISSHLSSMKRLTSQPIQERLVKRSASVLLMTSG